MNPTGAKVRGPSRVTQARLISVARAVKPVKCGLVVDRCVCVPGSSSDGDEHFLPGWCEDMASQCSPQTSPVHPYVGQEQGVPRQSLMVPEAGGFSLKIVNASAFLPLN